MSDGRERPPRRHGEALRPLWNTLLVNQFHDILPGSCISAAHDQSIAETTDMLRHADALLRAPALPEADSGVAFTIFNPLDEACSDAFYLPALPPELCAENEGVTLQPVVRADGTDATAVYGLSRPALGSAVLRLRRTSVPGGGRARSSSRAIRSPHHICASVSTAAAPSSRSSHGRTGWSGAAAR